METEPMRYSEPDWLKISKDVAERLAYLRAIWRKTKEQASDEDHQAMCRDLFVPALEGLMMFCDAVKVEDD